LGKEDKGMVASPKKVISVLPLENGDRLSRCEFERRYQGYK
jgi:hypothetical protein